MAATAIKLRAAMRIRHDFLTEMNRAFTEGRAIQVTCLSLRSGLSSTHTTFVRGFVDCRRCTSNCPSSGYRRRYSGILPSILSHPYYHNNRSFPTQNSAKTRELAIQDSLLFYYKHLGQLLTDLCCAAIDQSSDLGTSPAVPVTPDTSPSKSPLVSHFSQNQMIRSRISTVLQCLTIPLTPQDSNVILAAGVLPALCRFVRTLNSDREKDPHLEDLKQWVSHFQGQSLSLQHIRFANTFSSYTKVFRKENRIVSL